MSAQRSIRGRRLRGASGARLVIDPPQLALKLGEGRTGAAVVHVREVRLVSAQERELP